MEYTWILLGLFVLIGLLTLIGTESTSIPPIDEDQIAEGDSWENEDAWGIDDIYTDPAYYWLPGNIYYSGDDDDGGLS